MALLRVVREAFRHLLHIWRYPRIRYERDPNRRWEATFVWIAGTLSFIPFLYLAWIYAVERLDWHDSSCMIELSILPGKFLFPHNRYINAITEFPAILAHRLSLSPLFKVRMYSLSLVTLHWVIFTITWYFLKRRGWALLIPLLYASQWDMFYFAMSENPIASSLFFLSALLLYEGVVDRSVLRYIAALLTGALGLFFTHPQAGQLFLGAGVIMGVSFLMERRWAEILKVGLAVVITGLLVWIKVSFFASGHEQNKVAAGMHFLEYFSKPVLNSQLIGVLYYYAPHKILYLLLTFFPIFISLFRSAIYRNMMVSLAAAGVFYAFSVFISQTGGYGIPGLEIYLYGQIGMLLFAGYVLVQGEREGLLLKPRGLWLFMVVMLVGWIDVYQSRHPYQFKSRFVERLSRRAPYPVDSCQRIYSFTGYWQPYHRYAGDYTPYLHVFWNRKVFSAYSVHFSQLFGTFHSGGYLHMSIRGDSILRKNPRIRHTGFGAYWNIDSLASCSVTHLQDERDIQALEEGRVYIQPDPGGYTLPARALYTVAEVRVMHSLSGRLASVPDIVRRLGFMMGYRLYDENHILVNERTYDTWMEGDLLSGEVTGIFIRRPRALRRGWIQFGFVMFDGRFVPSGERVPFRVEWSLYDYLREWIAGHPFCR